MTNGNYLAYLIFVLGYFMSGGGTLWQARYDTVVDKLWIIGLGLLSKFALYTSLN